MPSQFSHTCPSEGPSLGFGQTTLEASTLVADCMLAPERNSQHLPERRDSCSLGNELHSRCEGGGLAISAMDAHRAAKGGGGGTQTREETATAVQSASQSFIIPRNDALCSEGRFTYYIDETLDMPSTSNHSALKINDQWHRMHGEGVWVVVVRCITLVAEHSYLSQP
jgi:hypothetical protein